VTRARALMAAGAFALTAAAPGSPSVIHHATGTFTVKITPEAQVPAPDGGLPTARIGISKTFTGAMTGTATGTMLSAGTPAPGKPAGYVAVDQFRGRVDGRDGGFLLLHRGTVDPAGSSNLSVVVAPGTGTGALTGIAGTFAIRIEGGVHHYDLAYTVPARE
jgi:hypothetical protein